MKIFWSLLKVLLMILKTKQQQQQKPVFWFYFWSKWKCESKTIQQIISIRWTVVSEADTLKHQWPKVFFVNLIWYNKKLLTVEEATAHWAILWEVRNDCGGGGSLNEVTTQVLDCSKCMVQLIFSIIQAKQSPFHIATMYVLKIWCCDFKTIIWRTSQKTNR